VCVLSAVQHAARHSICLINGVFVGEKNFEYKFLILDTSIRTLYFNVSKDVRIRGSSSKSKYFREQNSL
jgi:hypothetical protein